MQSEIYRIAAGITHPISLAAFAIAIILVILRFTKKVPSIVWIVISLLVIGPIAVSAFIEIRKDRTQREAIFRVRVTIIDPAGTPVEDAKVWSTFGGEPKKVSGGWELDIPKASRPAAGTLTVYASVPNRFLTGEQQLQLAVDPNPAVTIRLHLENSASIRGIVVDGAGRAIAGVRVSVVGYGNEAVLTQAGGNFVLPAHAAPDQQVQLNAEKAGYAATLQWHPAGDFPATIVLDRR